MRRVVIMVGCLIPACFVSADIPLAERDVLIALYNATDGANWDDNSNWRNAGDTDFNDPGTECGWYGVGCAGDLKVTSLYLGYNHLVGSIPPELGNLSYLLNLDLGGNQLSGTIPSELGYLSDLSHLHLEGNRLSGTIPSGLGNTNLKQLDLYVNQLTGPIPPELGNCTGLTRVKLFKNHLTGSIPPELGDLSQLRYLYLSENDLTGPIPPELGNLFFLIDLWLYRNDLTGPIPPELGNLENLRTLEMDTNRLSGAIPPELGNLSNLVVLFLASNELSGQIPAEVGNLQNLIGIHLESNQLAGPVPTQIQNLTNLSPWNTHFVYNALWTDDAGVQSFLDAKDVGWEGTQTVAPENLSIASSADHTVWLVWDPIAYIADRGGYEVFSESVVPRTAVSGGSTQAKSATTFPVTGLVPGQEYDFSVRTFTSAGSQNPNNTVVSDFSLPVRGTTTDTGCSDPQIAVSAEYPYTLTASDHDTWEWITGETTQSIEVRPHWPTWYWVATTDAGGCAEAAVAFAGEDLLFADGVESGDLSYWTAAQ